MIKLEKAAKPAVLVANEANWLAELLAFLTAGAALPANVKGRYRHPQIKEAIVAETFGKCAYCESKVLHVDFGHIEHIVPKSLKPELTFNWDNLTLACGVCNTNKGAHADVINPYAHDPLDHFQFLGPMVVPLNSSSLAKRSAFVLRLNRLDLIERRSAALESIGDRIYLMSEITDDETRSAIALDIIREVDNSREYSAFLRSFIYSIFYPISGDAITGSALE
jgi:uncharacterized protein (TIGR02646 family)